MCPGCQYRLAARGGIELQGVLEELETSLIEYFGTLNEIKAGIRSQPVEKPYELILYEMVCDMGLPVLAGGIMDQPHIWLLQYAVVRNIKLIFELQARQAEANKESANYGS